MTTMAAKAPVRRRASLRAGAFGGAEDLPADEKQEHGGEENAGVLGGEQQTGGDAG